MTLEILMKSIILATKFPEDKNNKTLIAAVEEAQCDVQ